MGFRLAVCMLSRFMVNNFQSNELLNENKTKTREQGSIKIYKKLELFKETKGSFQKVHYIFRSPYTNSVFT